MAKFVLTAQLQLQAPRNASAVIGDIQRQLQGVTVPVEIKNASSAIKQIDQLASSTQKASSAAESMGRSFGLAIKRFAAFTVASRAVSLFTNSLANAVDEAIAFQREVVRVSQVSGKSVAELKDLTNTITRLSTTLGTSSKDLLNTATILAQAGVQADDLKVALDALAKTTLAPNFDSITETAEGAVAILAQFQEGVGALERQLGSINAVAGAFAVEAEDLIGAVRRFGGVFKASGGSLEELLAIFTSVRATTRESAESISTGLRTIFTRIQRPKTIEFLRQYGVELLDLEGKFVGPFEAAKRLSEALSGLEEGDVRFIRVAEELGGFRQIGKVIPLLQQFSLAQNALNVAQKGSGSLAKDAATAQQALAVQITKVKEEFLALVRGIAESTSFQLFARTALEVASALIKVADAIKPLIPLIGAIAAFKFAKGLGSFAASAGAAIRGFGGGAKGTPMLNAGGKVLAFARGGMVPGTGNRDTVPAMLSPGEFVIRKSSVNKIGASTLAAMNNNKYAAGGMVNSNKSLYGSIAKWEDIQKAYPTLSKGQAQKVANGTVQLSKYKVGPEYEQKKAAASAQVEKRPKFQPKPGEIGGFILTPAQGQDPTYKARDKEFDILPTDEIYPSLVAEYKPQKGQPIKANLLAANYPEFYPGLTERDESGLKKVSAYGAAVTKGVEDGMDSSISSVVNAVKSQKLLDIPPAFDTDENVIALASKNMKADKGMKESMEGYLFEGMITALTGAEAAGGQASFDFPDLAGKKDKLKALFGNDRIDQLVLAEAKRSSGAFRDSDISAKGSGVLKKTVNNIKANKLEGIQQLASGGGISGSDTVPALLTPGEFVINKKAAQDIGYGNLNRMNKTGATRFAKGGGVGTFGVQRFFKGGQADKDVVRAQGKILNNLQDASKAFNDTIKDIAPEIRDSLLKTFKGIESVAAGSKATLGSKKSKAFTEGTRGQASVNEKGESSIGLQIRGSKVAATEETVAHETGHLADIALGQKSGKRGETGKGLASQQKGTFQFDLAEKVKPQMEAAFKKAGKSAEEIQKYLASNEEIFAEFFAKASPEVRKIITSTTDSAKGMAELKAHLESAGSTYAGLEASDIGGSPQAAKKAPAQTKAKTPTQLKNTKNAAKTAEEVISRANTKAGMEGIVATGAGGSTGRQEKSKAVYEEAKRNRKAAQGRIKSLEASGAEQQAKATSIQGQIRAKEYAAQQGVRKSAGLEQAIGKQEQKVQGATTAEAKASLAIGEQQNKIDVANQFQGGASKAQYAELERLKAAQKKAADTLVKENKIRDQMYSNLDKHQKSTVAINKEIDELKVSYDKVQKANEAIAQKTKAAVETRNAASKVENVAGAASGAKEASAKTRREIAGVTAGTGGTTPVPVGATVSALNIKGAGEGKAVDVNKPFVEAKAAKEAAKKQEKKPEVEGPELDFTKLSIGISAVIGGLSYLKPEIDENSSAFAKFSAGLIGGLQTLLGAVLAAAAALQTFGIKLNAQNLKDVGKFLVGKKSNIGESISGKITGGTDKLGAMLNKLPGPFGKLGNIVTKLGPRLGTMAAAAGPFIATVGVGVLAMKGFTSVVDNLTGVHKKYKDAIEQGNVAAAGEAAVRSKNADAANKLAVGAVVAGAAIGTAFGPIGTVVGGAIGAVVGIAIKLADAFGLLEGPLNAARDAMAFFGLGPSTDTVKQEARLAAAKKKQENEAAKNARDVAMAMQRVESGSSSLTDEFKKGNLTGNLNNEFGVLAESIALSNSRIADVNNSFWAMDGVAQGLAGPGGTLLGLDGAIQSYLDKANDEARGKALEEQLPQQEKATAAFMEQLPMMGNVVSDQILRGATAAEAEKTLTDNAAFKAATTSQFSERDKARIEANMQKRKEGKLLTKTEANEVDIRTQEKQREDAAKQTIEAAKKAAERQLALIKAINFGLGTLSDSLDATNRKLSKLLTLDQVGDKFGDSLDTLQTALSSAAGTLSKTELDGAISTLEGTLREAGANEQSIANASGAARGFSTAFSRLDKDSDAFKNIQNRLKIGEGKSPEAAAQVVAEELTAGLPEDVAKRISDGIATADFSAGDIASIKEGNFGPLQEALKKTSDAFNEEVLGVLKKRSEAEQLLIKGIQQRAAAEQEYVAAQRKAIDLQLEAGKIIEEFGGKAMSSQEKQQARVASFNVGAEAAGVRGLQGGSAADIQSVAADINNQFLALEERARAGVVSGQRAFSGGEGAEADTREKLKSLQQDLIEATRKEIDARKEELQLIQKKNQAEKDSLEKLLAGDVEGFLEGQAASGAGAALATGNANLTGLFSASALGAGFKTLEGQNLTSEQKRKAEDLTLERFGIQSTGVLSGTTVEEQAKSAEIQALAQQLGSLGQQAAEFERAEFNTKEAIVNAQKVEIANIGQQLNQALGGGGAAPQVPGMYRGGMVYASRGMFIPRGTDTVPAMLTPGEFVVNRSAVQRGNNLQILRAMNTGGGASAPGAMSGGGKVQYYGWGGIVESLGNTFSSALPQLSTVFTDFAATVDKLINTKFQVALDPTNINVNFNGASFLATLKEDLSKEILDQVGKEIQTYKSNNSGDLVKKQGVL